MSWFAEIENVVFPTVDAISTIARLPAQMWSGPFSRYRTTEAWRGQT
jgi:hypothetical protein